MGTLGHLSRGEAGEDPQPPKVYISLRRCEQIPSLHVESSRDPAQDLRTRLGGASLPARHSLSPSYANQPGELVLGESSPLTGDAQCLGVNKGFGAHRGTPYCRIAFESCRPNARPNIRRCASVHREDLCARSGSMVTCVASFMGAQKVLRPAHSRGIDSPPSIPTTTRTGRADCPTVHYGGAGIVQFCGAADRRPSVNRLSSTLPIWDEGVMRFPGVTVNSRVGHVPLRFRHVLTSAMSWRQPLSTTEGSATIVPQRIPRIVSGQGVARFRT